MDAYGVNRFAYRWPYSTHLFHSFIAQEHWNRQYAALKAFQAENGHCLVPRIARDKLGDFVTEQRRQYKLMREGKATRMTPKRKALLDELGFVWQVRQRTGWNDRFEECTYCVNILFCQLLIVSHSLIFVSFCSGQVPRAVRRYDCPSAIRRQSSPRKMGTLRLFLVLCRVRME